MAYDSYGDEENSDLRIRDHPDLGVRGESWVPPARRRTEPEPLSPAAQAAMEARLAREALYAEWDPDYADMRRHYL